MVGRQKIYNASSLYWKNKYIQPMKYHFVKNCFITIRHSSKTRVNFFVAKWSMRHQFEYGHDITFWQLLAHQKVSTWKGHNDMAILLDKSSQKSFFVWKNHVRTVRKTVIGRIFCPFAQSIPAYTNPLFILRIMNKTVLCIIWTYCYGIK